MYDDDEIRVLDYRDDNSRPKMMRVWYVDDEPHHVGGYWLRRVVNSQNNVEYLQKGLRLPGGDRRLGRAASPEALELLDNEIQIGLHLVRTYGADTYPKELSQLVGYYVDDSDPEPFVLVRERGEPSDKIVQRLLLEAEEHYPVSLLRALEYLAAAGVVHRTITPENTRWDDRNVQLVDFRFAVLAGEPAGASPAYDWSAPEAEAYTEAASPLEDLFSAGLVLLKVMTGHEPLPGAPPAAEALSRIAGGRLVSLLAEQPRDRPDVTELLDQLDPARYGPRLLSRRAAAVTPSAYLDAARRFDELRRRHRIAAGHDPSDDETLDSPAAGRGGNSGTRPSSGQPLDDTRPTMPAVARGDGTYGRRDY